MPIPEAAVPHPFRLLCVRRKRPLTEVPLMELTEYLEHPRRAACDGGGEARAARRSAAGAFSEERC